jgi:hypothetical protein
MSETERPMTDNAHDPEPDWERFAEIIRNGGSILVHPETLAAARIAKAGDRLVVSYLLGCRVIASEFVPLGQWAAVIPEVSPRLEDKWKVNR